MVFVIFFSQVHEEVRDFGFARNQGMAALHTGGAVGASSVLLILPRKPQQQTQGSSSSSALAAAAAAAQSSAQNPPLPPHGVVVAILCNMEDVGLRSLAMDIAREFQVRQTPHVRDLIFTISFLQDLKTDAAYRVQKVYQC